VAELSRPSDVATDEAVKTHAAAPARRLDIISHRNIFFLISLIIIVPGILSMVTRGFLLGIGF
jgi:preprotein translocase subunit SecF